MDVVAALSSVEAEQASQTFFAADLLLRKVRDISEQDLPDAAALRERAGAPRFYESLVGLQKLLPQVDAVGILDENGQVIASSRSFAPAGPRDLSQLEIFQVLRLNPEQGLATAGPIYVPFSRQWMFYLGRALFDSQGRFSGIALVDIAISYLEQSISTIHAGTDGSVALIGDDTRLIARWPRIDNTVGQRLGGPAPPALAPGGIPRLALIMGLDGRPRIVADTRLRGPGVNIHVAATQPLASVLKPWWTVTAAIGAFALMALAVLALLVRLLLRWHSDEAHWRAALLNRERNLSQHAASLAVARDQAESAQRARGLFFANMSHELRTPLNAVLGFSDCIKNEIFGPVGNPKYLEFADDIHSSGQHLLDIINNILDLSKMDSGKLSLFIDDIAIAELMQFAAKLVANAARSGEITLDVRLPSPDLTVRGDPVRLRQILLNLLSNAIKFTPGGGTVVLAAEHEGDWLAIRVADTGVGMTADETDKVMKPFYQVDSSASRHHQGTGLGLPLTKSLVDLHGGRLEIETALGVGTTVTVYLRMDRDPVRLDVKSNDLEHVSHPAVL